MACSFLALCGSYLLLILRESSDWAQTMQTRSNCNSRYSAPFLTAFLMSYCNIPNKHGLRKIKHLFSHCKLLKLWVTPQKWEWTLILALCFSTSLHKNIQCGYRLPIASEHREKSWNKTRHRVYKNSSGGNVVHFFRDFISGRYPDSVYGLLLMHHSYIQYSTLHHRLVGGVFCVAIYYSYPNSVLKLKGFICICITLTKDFQTIKTVLSAHAHMTN